MVTECFHGYRRGVWEYHLNFIQKHNLEADRGIHTFFVGVNEYADMVSGIIVTMAATSISREERLIPPLNGRGMTVWSRNWTWSRELWVLTLV